MMRDQQQKDYPNIFSLQEETAIKQHISSIFETSKKADIRTTTIMMMMMMKTAVVAYRLGKK